MTRHVVISILFFCIATAARADILADTELIYHGPLSDGTEIYCYELKVLITGTDAWTVAGGPATNEPWITLEGGTFRYTGWYPPPGTPPPSPPPPPEPDEQYTCLYTSPSGWPNQTAGSSPSVPGFAYGPVYLPHELIAGWFMTPDGYDDPPGYYTIARFTILPEQPDWVAMIDAQVGSRDAGVISFTQTLPEPGGLALLVLGAVTTFRRR